MNEATQQRRAKIRVINQGTSYDVVGRLKALARAIERGDYGRVTDVGIVVKSFKGSETHLDIKHVGTGTPGDLTMMATYFQNKASR